MLTVILCSRLLWLNCWSILISGESAMKGMTGGNSPLYLQRTLTETLATAGCPTPLAAVQTYSPSVCLSPLARWSDSPELRGKVACPALRLQLTRGLGSPWAEHLRV